VTETATVITDGYCLLCSYLIPRNFLTKRKALTGRPGKRRGQRVGAKTPLTTPDSGLRLTWSTGVLFS